MARRLHRLGTFTARHHWVVIGAWLAVLLLVVLAVKTIGSNTSNNLELPGTDSQAASDLLASDFPPQQNGASPIVFHVKQGNGTIETGVNEDAIKASLKAIKKLPHVYSATSPYSQDGAGQVSSDKRTTFIPVLLTIGNEEITEDVARSFLDAAAPARKQGMEVAAAGQIGSELSEPATESSEIVGLAAAMLILALTFGTLVAMGMPLISAVLGLLVGLSLIGLLGNVTEVPTIAPTLATMIGLGVGIDYALFLVSRYRTQRAEGDATEDAVATAVATSGTAIVFAGSTVVIALITLLIAHIPLVTSLGYASAFAVVTAVVAAITLLPAVLSLVGRHIDSLRLPAFLHPAPKPPDQGFWAAWSRFVTQHPGRAIAIALLILLPLIIPVFSLNLGQEDIGATPKDTTERQAYDLLASGFGPGYNGPLLVAVGLPSPAEPSSTYNKQYKKAKSLQSQLESEQATGEAQEAQLEAQATVLEAEQASLEGQKAELQGEATDLESQEAKLKRSSKKLQKKRDLLNQLNDLVGEATTLIKQDAVLSDKASTIRKLLARAQDPRLRAKLQTRLDAITEAQQQTKTEIEVLKGESAVLVGEAKKLGKDVVGLASDAADSAKEAVSLIKQKNKLQLQAANAKTQAAQLQTGKAQLQTLQVQSQYQQQQANNLKQKLTNELTLAGGDDRGTDPRLVGLQEALTETIDVKLVAPPQINKSGDAAVFTVIGKTDPADPAAAELVKRIRTYVIPQSTQGTGLEVHVGGQTASYVDLASAISAKLGLVIAAVIALGFCVLATAFRSLMIPSQAALANLLSVLAAFGVLTACFQFGWGLGLVGVDTSSGTDPIASFVPLIMFAVLFGLSMDYQVFLSSQIEQHHATMDDAREAIAAGLATGARVITAAALIMMSVFASFILNGDPTVKQFGVGLSVGVALAAMTVLLLAPALMTLAAERTWWLPAWADRILPNIDIEGAGEAEKVTAKPKAKPRAKKTASKRKPAASTPKAKPKPAPRKRKHDDLQL